MLGSAAVVEAVARKCREYAVQHLVIDPVLVSTSGALLLEESGIDVLKSQLLPLAELITPNLAESAQLSGMEVRTLADMEQAVRRLHNLGARNVLLKGGHLEGDAVDVFFDGMNLVHFRAERIDTPNLHGTGCVLSAAIASHLALGLTLTESIASAKDFVSDAIRRGLRLGKGRGPVNPQTSR